MAPTEAPERADGFSEAFATLVDTHLTTLVSCAFLFFFGTPAVQGFAATLMLEPVTNLFTLRIQPRLRLGDLASKARRTIEYRVGSRLMRFM
jgi:preprotein translocase subunit SecD